MKGSWLTDLETKVLHCRIDAVWEAITQVFLHSPTKVPQSRNGVTTSIRYFWTICPKPWRVWKSWLAVMKITKFTSLPPPWKYSSFLSLGLANTRLWRPWGWPCPGAQCCHLPLNIAGAGAFRPERINANTCWCDTGNATYSGKCTINKKQGNHIKDVWTSCWHWGEAFFFFNWIMVSQKKKKYHWQEIRELLLNQEISLWTSH